VQRTAAEATGFHDPVPKLICIASNVSERSQERKHLPM
jgi:hypothetical protein